MTSKKAYNTRAKPARFWRSRLDLLFRHSATFYH